MVLQLRINYIEVHENMMTLEGFLIVTWHILHGYEGYARYARLYEVVTWRLIKKLRLI